MCFDNRARSLLRLVNVHILRAKLKPKRYSECFIVNSVAGNSVENFAHGLLGDSLLWIEHTLQISMGSKHLGIGSPRACNHHIIHLANHNFLESL